MIGLDIEGAGGIDKDDVPNNPPRIEVEIGPYYALYLWIEF